MADAFDGGRDRVGASVMDVGSIDPGGTSSVSFPISA
jgi:hypothetical protein